MTQPDSNNPSAHAAHPVPTDFATADARPPSGAAPIAVGERFQSIDTLRGVAVLGILPMNVLTGFALVTAAFMNPAVSGGFHGTNFWIWVVTHILLDMKMMTIFSMLFGAGMIVMTDRADARRASAAAVYYRRTGWLLLIGFLHAYVLWFGDILFSYALCGLLLFLARKWSPAVLITLGVALTFVGAILFFGIGLLLGFVRESDPESWNQFWPDMRAGFDPTPQQFADEVEARGGSVPGLLLWNASQTLMMQLVFMPLFGLWRLLGVMLIGAGLMKLGVFAAKRSNAFYAAMIAVGYAIGFSLIILGMRGGLRAGFDVVYVHMWGLNANYFGSLFVALGHVGLVMLVCRLGLLTAARQSLACVGRMALTNYLTQTLICMFIFSAWGLGLFERFDRTQLMLIVFGIWGLQILWSPIWLAHFRFGPAEWLWRTLTYWKRQPMRLAPA